MKRLAVGILAHVDAGKTTLSEGLLYGCGQLKKLGRVDHQNAFLDTDAQERERGITIFSKQAVVPLETAVITLLDTPGHADFSAEMERTLQVLDYAILVISGADGVQGHTRTLWRLLERYGIPTFLFVNKMDQPGTDRAALLSELKSRLDDGCVDFGTGGDSLYENIAVCGEEALERYLETGRVEDGEICALIRRRRLFPCLFGSALRMEGVDALLDALERYTEAPQYPREFGAKIFKIARDSQGGRLTYLKVTGGSLRVKSVLTNRAAGLDGDRVWEEKADQIRIYSGAKFQAVDEAPAGTVCAVTGLSRTRPGEGLGVEAASAAPVVEPVLSYRVELPDGCDAHTALRKLRMLEEEDPQLHLVWNEQLREIHVQLMGEVQLEVLRRLMAERFGLEVGFGAGSIVYKETIAGAVEGVGHFEPLRHYAEVHLLLEPLPRGSGLRFGTACSEDVLDRAWQRLILTHLEEKTHLGVLTGAPITDMRMTLIAGRGHLKHTEGGDFRQATYRAVRQGLMCAESILLEPWYDFRLELPAPQVGRAMTDLQQMGAQLSPPETAGEEAVLTGAVAVSALGDYAREVAAYTQGRGRLLCSLRGYAPCADQDAVLASVDYDPTADLENTPDSVFCAHGGGFSVKWDQVPQYMHLESALPKQRGEDPAPVPRVYTRNLDLDEKELEAIFLRTFGPQRRREYQFLGQAAPAAPRRTIAPPKQQYLIVDGYNMIFAWDALKDLARENLDAARQRLMDILSNYQGYKQCRLVLVFDGYKVKGNPGTTFDYHHIHVVYTKQDETGDMFIEKLLQEIGRNYTVRVATSDGLIQLSALRAGVLRLSADELWREVEWVGRQIDQVLQTLNQKGRLSRDS